MDQYRRQLERIEIKICAILFALLFGGLLVLPRIGEYIWIAIIMAIYIRVIPVIWRREEQLDKLKPTSETAQPSAWHDAAERHIAIPDRDRTTLFPTDRDSRGEVSCRKMKIALDLRSLQSQPT